MEGGSSTGPPWAAPKPPTARQIGRMKLMWRAALISNFALGAYMFATPKKKQIKEESSKAIEEVSPPPVETTTTVHEEPIFVPPPEVPMKVQESVPEDQQRKLFKWMLEEKRKVKPQNRKAKQRVNEEKAIPKSIPSI